MHNDLLDILNKKDLPVTNEQLIAYLNGTLTEEERHNLEKIFIDSGMESDAVEGLQMLSNPANLKKVELELQRSLREKLVQKKTRRAKKMELNLPWLLVLTGALLAFILLLWLIVHLLQNPA